MLYTAQQVKDNIRNKEGKRVFYLGKADQLTSEAKDYLTRERIEILPGQMAKKDRYRLLGGGYIEEKPEHMTHLNAEYLVEKTHPRIVFRGGGGSVGGGASAGYGGVARLAAGADRGVGTGKKADFL